MTSNQIQVNKILKNSKSTPCMHSGKEISVNYDKIAENLIKLLKSSNLSSRSSISRLILMISSSSLYNGTNFRVVFKSHSSSHGCNSFNFSINNSAESSKSLPKSLKS